MIVDAGPILPSCTPADPTMAALLDFNAVMAGATRAQFGDFFAAFSGGTYEYPAAAIVSDFSGMTWHMTGTVADYSGFGLYFVCKANLSAYTGLQLDIGGTFTSNGMGDGGIPAPRVTVGLAQVADQLDTAHAGMPSWGTCTANCNSPSRAINLGATPVTVNLPWTSFSGGTPVGALDPTAITSVFFSFPWSGASTSQYTVDVTIDNIMFTGG